MYIWEPKCQPDLTEKNTQAEKFRPTPIAHMDCPGGPLDRDGVEVEELGKGLEMMRCFERGE